MWLDSHRPIQVPWHSLYMAWSVRGLFTSKPDHCVTVLLTQGRH